MANLWAHLNDHVGLQVTYLVYQDIIDAYAHPKRSVGTRLMRKVMNTIRKGLPAGLEELAQLGRTLWHKRKQVLAFVDHGGAGNRPVEAVNGQLEHLRGIALGFRDFDHYVLTLPHPLRPTHRQDQRTLKPEEPAYTVTRTVPGLGPTV